MLHIMLHNIIETIVKNTLQKETLINSVVSAYSERDLLIPPFLGSRRPKQKDNKFR